MSVQSLGVDETIQMKGEEAMSTECPIVNHSAELSEYRDQWTLDEAYNCWCLEDVLYVQEAETPLFQRLSIFVPKAFLNEDGTVNEKGTAGAYQAGNAPIVFENNSAGYMQMPHTWLGGPRNYGKQYLDHGLIYVTCGCRGRESRDQHGVSNGKSPITLVDLKTAIRFLRHNRAALPGDMEKIISVGWSAGGAMSSLLAVTGDNENYLPYLRANHAFMEESDAVFAAQIYCPIVDIEHADQAYEWMFHADKESEPSPFGPAEIMTPFKDALSVELGKQYIAYVNSLGLRHPRTGETLTLGEDGRSGSFYAYTMNCLADSATDFLTRLDKGELPLSATVSEYLSGDYTVEGPAPRQPGGKGAREGHHAGQDVALPDDKPGSAKTLGEKMLRPPKGVPFANHEPPTVTYQGRAKPWLTWDGTRARVSDLDTYVLSHRRRMKPCTSFDAMEMNSGENQEYGDAKCDYVHYNHAIADAMEAVKDAFPEEAARYAPAFAATKDDQALAERVKLINPMRFIGTEEKSRQAKHYRIRVGASDADTSLTVSMTLALALQKAGCGSVDYAMVWDQPHSEADYPGEVLDWIDGICLGAE